MLPICEAGTIPALSGEECAIAPERLMHEQAPRGQYLNPPGEECAIASERLIQDRG